MRRPAYCVYSSLVLLAAVVAFSRQVRAAEAAAAPTSEQIAELENVEVRVHIEGMRTAH